jgi:hypothetical protein
LETRRRKGDLTTIEMKTGERMREGQRDREERRGRRRRRRRRSDGVLITKGLPNWRQIGLPWRTLSSRYDSR